jgi:cytochrome b subunit of formate dehydrogenase/mono/diheme cytochrome c family protein
MRTAEQKIHRFSLAQRIEHIILVVSFTLLGLTGLPQKYALSPISQEIIALMGGIESIRVIHRVAATVFLLEAIYHAIVVGWKLWVERREATMMPTVKDGLDIAHSFMYNLGFRKTPPEMPRYNFGEKMEYLAMLWGFFVMAITGFMLWNPIITTNILPGQWIPAAKIAHGGEGLLAVLAIILWHFYNVHARHFNPSMFTGYMSREAMLEEHAAELKQIEAGQAGIVAPEPERKRRAALYIPVATVATVAMLGLVYWFVTYEDSARDITTIPPVEQVAVFVQQTATPAPTATTAPTAAPTTAGQASGGATLSWEGGLKDVFEQRCGSCHGTMGGFNARAYVEVLKGVNPGDPDNSVVVESQKVKHPGNFSDEELQQVIEWIKTGAPEK